MNQFIFKSFMIKRGVEIGNYKNKSIYKKFIKYYYLNKYKT